MSVYNQRLTNQGHKIFSSKIALQERKGLWVLLLWTGCESIRIPCIWVSNEELPDRFRVFLHAVVDIFKGVSGTHSNKAEEITNLIRPQRNIH